jgi:hypothetical protein
MLDVMERPGSSRAHRRLAQLYLEVAQSHRDELNNSLPEQCQARLNEKIAYNEGKASFYTMLAKMAERRGK